MAIHRQEKDALNSRNSAKGGKEATAAVDEKDERADRLKLWESREALFAEMERSDPVFHGETCLIVSSAMDMRFVYFVI